MSTLSFPAVFLILLAGACLAEVISLRSDPGTDLSPAAHVHIRKTHDAYAPGINEPLDLLDILLVASVDGDLHAVNRSYGQLLWSISSTADPHAFPTLMLALSFFPLLRR